MADDLNVQESWEVTDGDSQDMLGWTATLSHDSAAQLTMEPSVKKTKKKKKKKGCYSELAVVLEPEAVAEVEAVPELEAIPEPEPDAIPAEESILAEEPAPEFEATPEPDAVPAKESIVADEPAHECEIPPDPEEPEPRMYTSEPAIEKPKTPVAHGVGEPFYSAQGIDTPSPIYLNFNAQHRLMVFLQQKLEEMCFAFCQHRMPQTLLDNGWDCPESAELQNWVVALKEELPSTLRPKGRRALINSMSKIRDSAVSRTRINNFQLEELLSDALKLAMLLEQDQSVNTIKRIREDMEATYRYLDEERKQLEKSCNFKLGQITAARAKLDDLERATKAAFDKSLLTRHNKARSMVLESIQNAEALEHKLDPEDRSVTMSSLDLVNDLENSLTLDEDGGRLF
ncbi:unnamed protein product [Fusarium equiseti]|uniref:Ubiquinol-cytochrome-c reductase cytochrome c1 n=1 Tax=Fusarium equiseti TaxID=61235 RepID=A0A8J2NBL5_FUSEQ|nr:unnamed protein product [Fusarium equiseti]